MTTRSIDQTKTHYPENVAGVEVVEVYNSKPFTSMRLGNVSIGAILGGVLIALVIHLAMNLLGLSIGANTINPTTEINPIDAGLGGATVAWMAVSAIVSLLIGGWVAGRLSNTSNNINSTLHGIVTWALTWIIMFAFLGSALGGLINGLGSILTQGAAALTSGAVAAAPSMVDNLNLDGQTLQAFAGELNALLSANQTGTTTAPTTTDADGTTNTAQVQPTTTETQPMTIADLNFSRDVNAYVTNNQVTETELQTLALQLSERTSLTEAQASEQLTVWRTSFQDIRAEVVAATRQIGQAASDAVAAVAGSLFIILLVSMIAAAGGSFIGGTWRKETALQAAL